MANLKGPLGSPTASIMLRQAASGGNVHNLQAITEALAGEGKHFEALIDGYKDERNRSLLHFAAENGNTEMCMYLVEDVCLEVDAKDDDGDTPLLKATMGGHFQTVLFLIERDANLDLANKTTFSPLHCAVEQGQLEILELLLSQGANKDPLSTIGTPLQRAARIGDEKAVKALLDNNANAKADPTKGLHRMIPIVLAASEGEGEIVKYLLKAGVSVVQDSNDLEPIELAALNDWLDVVEILYPVTKSIPDYPEWTIAGIMKDVSSVTARREVIAEIESSIVKKKEGDEAFLREKYDVAIPCYRKYLEEYAFEALSRRCLCFSHLKNEDRIICDQEAMKLKVCAWGKDVSPKESCVMKHLMAGLAWLHLDMPNRAVRELKRGLKGPSDPKLLRALEESQLMFSL